MHISSHIIIRIKALDIFVTVSLSIERFLSSKIYGSYNLQMILGELEGMLIFWIFETWIYEPRSKILGEILKSINLCDAVCLRCCIFRLLISFAVSTNFIARCMHRLHTNIKRRNVASRYFISNKFALVYKAYCSPCRFLLRSRDWQHNWRTTHPNPYYSLFVFIPPTIECSSARGLIRVGRTSWLMIPLIK